MSHDPARSARETTTPAPSDERKRDVTDPLAFVESADEAEDVETAHEDSAPGDVPEADRLDQAREVMPGERRGPVSRELEVPEADAIEQAIEMPLDDDERVE